MNTPAFERGQDLRSDVRLAEVASAIALTADLAIGQPLGHMVRSCAIAIRLAEHLGLPQEDRETTYWVALLMLPGCTAVSFELSKFFGDEIALRADTYGIRPSVVDQLRFVMSHAGSGSPPMQRTRIRAQLVMSGMRVFGSTTLAHCAINARLAERIGLGERVTDALAQSFAYWNGKGTPRGLAGEEIAIAVRIANLADLVEAFDREQGADAALEAVRRWRGIWFDPAMVDAIHDVGPAILGEVDDEMAWEAVMSADPNRLLSTTELDGAFELLGDYADLKSPWFVGHSRAVSVLSASAADELAFPEPDVATLRHAALVHNLGRNGVSNGIWDKSGPLSDDQWERVRLAPYYTGRVLQRAGRLATLASIASSAHERLRGTGYPRAIAGETIPSLGRVLACADVYQAMMEDRPHRPAHPRAAAAKELRRLAREGDLDGASVDAVLSAAGHDPRKRPSAPAGLTPREIEVLEIAARGATTRQIASRLGISPKTAGNHIERIYLKIGVQSRAEAALFAMEHGLVRTSEP